MHTWTLLPSPDHMAECQCSIFGPGQRLQRATWVLVYIQLAESLLPYDPGSRWSCALTRAEPTAPVPARASGSWMMWLCCSALGRERQQSPIIIYFCPCPELCYVPPKIWARS